MIFPAWHGFYCSYVHETAVYVLARAVTLVFGLVTSAASLVVGLVMLGAGLSKVRVAAAFADQIDDYQLIPGAATRFTARLITFAEILSGALLLAGLAVPAPVGRTGAGIGAVLLAVFLTALINAHLRGRNIACACFGGDGELETIGPHSIVRTGLLLVLASVATASSPVDRPLETVGVAAIFAALLALLSEMARLLGPLRQTTTAIVAQMTAATTVASERH